MKSLSIILALVGMAMGQDATQMKEQTQTLPTPYIEKALSVDSAPVVSWPEGTTGLVPLLCKFIKPTLVDCRTPPKSEPVDVPAIQESGSQCDYNSVLKRSTCHPLQIFTCSDPHNYALLTSVDGSLHVCHRIGEIK